MRSWKFQPTPLRGPKIVRILNADFSSTVISVYGCGAAKRQAVGPLLDAKPIGVVSSARKE